MSETIIFLKILTFVVLKYEALETSLDTLANSFDLLETTNEKFQRTVNEEYNLHEQKLKQSIAINEK